MRRTHIGLIGNSAMSGQVTKSIGFTQDALLRMRRPKVLEKFAATKQLAR